jgi:hypothetical protein
MPNQLVIRDQFAQSLYQALNRGEVGLREVPVLLCRAIEEEVWKERTIETRGNRYCGGFATMTEFIHAERPDGLGADIGLVLRMCARDEAALKALAGAGVDTKAAGAELIAETPPSPKHGGARTTRPKEQDVRHVLTSAHGRDSAGLIARMKRDCPQFLDAYERGEYPSIKAAAVAAGIVQPRWSVPEDPVKLAQALQRHYSPSDLQLLIRHLGCDHGGAVVC